MNPKLKRLIDEIFDGPSPVITTEQMMEISLHDPTLSTCLMMWESGQLTYEESLTLALVHHIREHHEGLGKMMKILTDNVFQGVATKIVADYLKKQS